MNNFRLYILALILSALPFSVYGMMLISGEGTDIHDNKYFTLGKTTHNNPQLRVRIVKGTLTEQTIPYNIDTFVNDTDSSLTLSDDIKKIPDAQRVHELNQDWIADGNGHPVSAGDCKKIGGIFANRPNGYSIHLIHAFAPKGIDPQYEQLLTKTYESLFKEFWQGFGISKIAMPLLGYTKGGDVTKSIHIALKTLLNYRLNNELACDELIFVIPDSYRPHITSLFEQEILRYNSQEYMQKHLIFPITNHTDNIPTNDIGRFHAILKSPKLWAGIFGVSAVMAIATAAIIFYRKYVHNKKHQKHSR